MRTKSSLLAFLTLAPTAALAQTDPVPPAPPPAPPAEEAPPAPVVTAPAPAPAAPAAAAPASGGLTINTFADAAYVWSTRKNGVGDNDPDTMDVPNLAHPGHRSWERNNGFALQWLGIDASYDAGQFGVTTSLRYGSALPAWYGVPTNSSSDLDGVANILNAYGTWKPTSSFSVDVGRFTTIYGAEVHESFKNLNYTRGALFYAFQPFWHTGLRLNYQATDELKLVGLVVNGVNNSLDAGKERPSLGAQAVYAAGDLGLSLGYLGTTDKAADLFQHFVDLVATYNAGPLAVVLNGDFFTNKQGPQSLKYFGGSLALGYTVSQFFRVAVRGETLVYDKNDATAVMGKGLKVYTSTLTLDYRPLGTGNVVIRLDGRYETSSEKIFFDRDNAPTKGFFQAVLGVAVTSS